MTALPPFSGDEPTCTKCGQVGAYTQHRKDGEAPDAHWQQLSEKWSERLERRCQRCGYEWDEAIAEPCTCTPNDACSNCYARRNP